MVGCNLFERHFSCHRHIFHKQETAEVFGKDRASVGIVEQLANGQTGVQARGAWGRQQLEACAQTDIAARGTDQDLEIAGSVAQAFLAHRSTRRLRDPG